MLCMICNNTASNRWELSLACLDNTDNDSEQTEGTTEDLNNKDFDEG